MFKTKLASNRSQLVAIALLAFAANLGAQKADITYFNTKGAKRTDENARIKEWTYSGLTFRGRTERTISMDAVISVKFIKPPTVFEDATAAYEDGDDRAALELFETILDGVNAEGKKLRPSELWCREHAYYHAWLINRRIGRYEEAKANREGLLKDFAKSHYKPKMEISGCDDLYAYGDFGKAIAAYDALSDEAKKRGYANDFVVRAGLGKVRALLGAGKKDDAANALNAVTPKAASDGQRLRVELLRGELLLAQGKSGQAESIFRQLASQAEKDYESTPFLLAGAANGLGDCLFATGKHKEAAFEYSKTFALFADRDGLDHELGWAFWQFANCCKQLAAKTEGDESVVYKRRFGTNRNRAASNYRLSRGGQLARREQGLGR